MVQLDLTRNEQIVLQETLESCLNDLGFEISDAADEGYRTLLNSREAVVRKVLAQLEELEEIPPATRFVE